MKTILAIALTSLAASAFAAGTGRYDDPVASSTMSPDEALAAQPTTAPTGRYDEPIASSTMPRAQVLAELREAQRLHVMSDSDPRSHNETAAEAVAIHQAGLRAIGADTGMHAGE